MSKLILFFIYYFFENEPLVVSSYTGDYLYNVKDLRGKYIVNDYWFSIEYHTKIKVLKYKESKNKPSLNKGKFWI